MKTKYPKNEEKLWKGLEEVFKNKDTYLSPIKDFHMFGISVLIWKQFEFKAEALETQPYKMDGEVPVIFLNIGPVEIIFENKCIYKYLYKRKHNRLPKGI